MITIPGDYVPYGNTSAQLPSSEDYCPKCAEGGMCPRCESQMEWHELENPEYFTCSECGWSDNPEVNEAGDGLPESPECFCGYNDEEEIAKSYWDQEKKRMNDVDPREMY